MQMPRNIGKLRWHFIVKIANIAIQTLMNIEKNNATKLMFSHLLNSQNRDNKDRLRDYKVLP